MLDQDSTLLETIFQLEHVEIQAAKEWGEIPVIGAGEGKDGSFTGRFYRQLIKPKAGVKVLACFEDGEPAVTETCIGKGKAIFIGTYPSYHYEHTRADNNRQFLLRWMDRGGYPQIRAIAHSGQKKEGFALAPVVRMLQTEAQYLLVIVNHCEETVQLEIEYWDAQKECLALDPAVGQIIYKDRDPEEKREGTVSVLAYN